MEQDDEPNNSFRPPQPQLQEHAANVGDLMAKAKKAAASLWLILHAQVSDLSLGHFLLSFALLQSTSF